ncbi:MAG: hypothetical protein J4A00_10445 [Gammaproteobacteria bacterium]|nr:hypothetical protein [Gammaproteobacteria bacterium]
MILDSFGETIHVKSLHKFHITDTVVGPDNPDSHLLSAHLHRRNRSFSTFANLTHQPTPAEAIAYKYGYATWTEQDTAGQLPPGLNPGNHEAWAFDGVVIFPNLLMVSSNYWMAVFRPIPIAVNKTRFEIDYYVTKPTNAGERMCQEYARCAVRDAVREDAEILENCQENLMAGVITHLPLSNQEVVLRHNHWSMDQALQEMEDQEKANG